MLAVFGSGALAGLALFSVQHFTVIPLIQAAETYETVHSGAAHEDVGWQPTGGWERISFTALTTMLTGICFAAMLFGVMALAGETINSRHGAVWGLAAFGCFSLAPALGLLPQPLGVAVADLHQRQLWWAGTVIATAIGVWFIARKKRSWLLRIWGLRASCFHTWLAHLSPPERTVFRINWSAGSQLHRSRPAAGPCELRIGAGKLEAW